VPSVTRERERERENDLSALREYRAYNTNALIYFVKRVNRARSHREIVPLPISKFLNR